MGTWTGAKAASVGESLGLAGEDTPGKEEGCGSEQCFGTAKRDRFKSACSRARFFCSRMEGSSSWRRSAARRRRAAPDKRLRDMGAGVGWVENWFGFVLFQVDEDRK